MAKVYKCPKFSKQTACVLRAQHTASAVRAAERESPHVSFLVHHVVSSSELL
jgi:hypothetical protein